MNEYSKVLAKVIQGQADFPAPSPSDKIVLHAFPMRGIRKKRHVYRSFDQNLLDHFYNDGEIDL